MLQVGNVNSNSSFETAGIIDENDQGSGLVGGIWTKHSTDVGAAFILKRIIY